MASSLAAAASSTSSRRASRGPCASSGSAMRSTRSAPSTRPTSGAPGRSTRRRCCQPASSSSGPTLAPRSGGASGAWPGSCPRPWRPTWRGSRRARSATPPSCGVATWHRRPGSTTWARPSGCWTSRATSPTWPPSWPSRPSSGARSWSASGSCRPGWASAYPEPRAWKSALAAARTLELTWEPEAEGAPPGGNPFGWHEPVLPPARIGGLAESVRRWRQEGAHVVLASDQSARLAELLGEADIVAAPASGLHEPVAAGGLAIIERSLNGGFCGWPGRPRLRHRPGALRVGARATSASHAPRRPA